MKKRSFKDVTPEQRQEAAERGISVTTIRNRLGRGWTIEDAISEAPKGKGGRNDRSKMVYAEEKKENKDDTLISVSWFAGTNKGLKCPHPDCNHIGMVITKAHCRLVHGMEREEIGRKYGMPEVVESKGEILSENNGRAWYSTSTGMGVL